MIGWLMCDCVGEQIAAGCLIFHNQTTVKQFFRTDPDQIQHEFIFIHPGELLFKPGLSIKLNLEIGSAPREFPLHP